MKIKLILATVLIAIAFTTMLPFAGSGVDAAPGSQKFCPVMGFDITKDLFTDYKSKRVYLCCPSCPPEFKKTPEVFMEQMREQGVILEDIQA